MCGQVFELFCVDAPTRRVNGTACFISGQKSGGLCNHSSQIESHGVGRRVAISARDGSRCRSALARDGVLEDKMFRLAGPYRGQARSYGVSPASNKV
jgi:hypothetical protein